MIPLSNLMRQTARQIAANCSSNAQRDVLDIFLIDYAIGSGDAALSRRLLHEYLDLRPGSVPMQARLPDSEAA